MREIKFRAWDGQRMFYGILPWAWDSVIKTGFWYCSQSRDNNDVAKFEVDVQMSKKDFIIMQYTGLKDKNGKEIYEGDIICHVNYIDKPKYIIRFGIGYIDASDFEDYSIKINGFYLESIKKKKDEYGYGYPPSIMNIYDYSEVIGNIYENPELLEVKK